MATVTLCNWYNWAMLIYPLLLMLLEAIAMLYPVVTFTSGHISVRRGKILRKYTPGQASTMRLSNVLQHGPSNHRSTNRSSIYTWHGMSTLDTTQMDLYTYAIQEYKKYYHSCDSRDLLFYMGVSSSCSIMGIHKVLLELIHPCEHDNAESRCYTCATSM